MSKIVEFKIGKGRTTKPGPEEEWSKKYLEVVVKLPEKYTEEDFQEALLRAEYILDNWIAQPIPSDMNKIPQFNPEDLMKHEWKGKKTGDGQYAKGSVSWGWDFKDKFPESVIKALEKGPIIIDEYEFTGGKTIVQAHKKKKAK